MAETTFVLEIAANPNCDAVEMRIFHELEPPRAVTQVRVEHDQAGPRWCAVTGWSLGGSPSPALARKVDDSGEGVIWLVSGGEAGLRLQPAGRDAPWRADDALQWGRPFLLMADSHDLRFVPAAPQTAPQTG